MPRVPLFASRIALVSVLTGMSSLLGCGDSEPSTTGTATTSAGGASSSSSTSSSGSGGAESSSSVSSGSGGNTSATSSSGASGSSGASASSSSGASGSSGASSSSSGGNTGGLGAPCTTSADCTMPPPNSALFCDKPGCGAGPGTCALQPTSQLGLSQAEAPVCGCDHVTYWNAEYAAFHGVSIGAQGACAAGGVACDPTTPCPGTMKCNRLVTGQPQCSASAPGSCWSMPASCPAGGAAAQACSNGSCQSVCDLIQSQNPWWNDATCP